MEDFKSLILNISQKNLENQDKRYKDMDNKAISIITITGVLTSFLVGSGSLMNSINAGSPESSLSQYLYALTALSFLVTVLLSIWVIKVRLVKMFHTKLLLNMLNEKNPTESNIMEFIIPFFTETEADLFESCNKKGKILSYSVYFLGFSVVLLICYSISVLK